jgi:ketosteroid isomerase-like protein
MNAISIFTDAVNRGDVPAAVSLFTEAPSITEDGPPFHWTGSGAGAAWIASMGANADARGVSTINMRLSPATRVEAAGDRAYAIVPGVLTYAFNDGHSERADGLLTFALQRIGADWKIETLTWTGPQAK